MCKFCEITDKRKFTYTFGKDFENDRPDDKSRFCLRKANWPDYEDIELHVEFVSTDDSGQEYCDCSGNVKINFCPICGRDLREGDTIQ